VWGCLVVLRCGDGASFTDAEFRFVSRFSDAAALALENEETRSRLRTLALTDELTGVLNRRGFYGALDRELAQASRSGGETSVLVVDLDGLKRINDAHGHDAGDAVLARIAQLLAANVRAGDVVGRMGGDEFAVCLPATDAHAAREVAGQLEEMLDAVAVAAAGATIVARATIGLATVRGDGDGARTALRDADLAMYARKARQDARGREEPAEPGASAASGHEAIGGV
jgi:diguanylate cyclase (GGDEF)-like protein